MPLPIFAHLHSSPLVVRRRSGANWRSLSPHADINGSSSGLEAVELIDVKAERRLLLETLRESGRKLAWHSEVADLHAFRKVLSFGCRALHFSGHGVPGQVIFETRKGEAQFVSQQELQDLLLAGGAESRRPRHKRDKKIRNRQNRRQKSSESSDSSSESSSSYSSSDDATSGLAIRSHRVERGWVALSPPPVHAKPKTPLQLVFVSACHSESVAQAFVSAGVPHVVVVSREEKVLDRKAMEFAKAFYTALFAGHSVAKSFQIGIVQADIAVASNASTGRPSEFILLGDGDHNDALFRDVAVGDCVETEMGGRRGSGTVNECDTVAEVFVGRSLEVHQVYKSLVEGARLVSITGERGIGKTEVALQCAQYATERRIFRHIFYLRLSAGNEREDDMSELEPSELIIRFAKCLGLQATTLDELAEQARQRCEVESQGDGNNFLLILDGCNRAQRQTPRFYTIVAMLLRRVNSLALLLTGDGKFGALDGVGEKIISVGPLPAADAALLFTFRAPRKIKAHEMGGSADLEAFGEHPIIKSLRGHPRTICAVSQFLEKKDMELDQREFLNYIIPSVNTGLCMGKIDATRPDCGLESHQRNEQETLRLVKATSMDGCSSNPHKYYKHSHAPCILEEVEYQHRPRAQETQIRRMKPVASRSDVFTAKSSLLSSGSSDGQGTDSPPLETHPLVSTRSEPSLTGSIASPTTSLQQLCLLKVADHVRPIIQSEGGSLVWARAVVLNASLPDCRNPGGGLKDGYSAAAVRQLQELKEAPMDWIAPQVSCFFATKLKADAAKRPLSSRSIDFLSKSSLVWGRDCAAPAQRGGAVSLRMFSAFWAWFRPLVDCILYSTLWPHTEPRLLHGFLSKGACVSMLERAPPGTFLLRFSETRVRCLVIAYVRDDQYVQFVPTTWLPERGGWFVALEDDNSGAANNGVTFPTIQELILSVNVLKFLFPHSPKEAAFTLQGRKMKTV
ncbi:SH2 domain [Phytophthora infestans]|uniref:SH2 domain n=1 Tax=Phytophthora infestans TaxID=4787 RepID=A0A8S9TP81_PHYIN|nr:SH2 domain [Phytophthora infestans]